MCLRVRISRNGLKAKTNELMSIMGESDSLKADDQKVSIEQRNKSRLTLVMILVVAVVPVLAAYTMFFTGVGVPENTVNNGELVKAISLEKLVDGETWQAVSEEKKWRLFLPVGEHCNQKCQDNFYTTRQVHVRLGEKGLRVERYAINYGGVKGDEYLRSIAESHPRLKRADVELSVWNEWSAPLVEFNRNADSHFYLLVDQEGFAMMAYTDQHGNDLLKDIKRALRFSIDYQ